MAVVAALLENQDPNFAFHPFGLEAGVYFDGDHFDQEKLMTAQTSTSATT